jgi:hypothetical protein
MKRKIAQDPYCGFRNDRERRRALNTRERWQALTKLIPSLARISIYCIETIRWLMHLYP